MKNRHRDRKIHHLSQHKNRRIQNEAKSKSFQSKEREKILHAEGNKTAGNPLPKDVKDAKSWVQEETGQVHGRNPMEG